LLTPSASNPDVWKDIAFPSEAVAEELKSYIGKRLTPQPTKVRADVEVTCFEYEGIDAIKTALRTAEAKNTADTQVKCRLVSPPLYVYVFPAVIQDPCASRTHAHTHTHSLSGRMF